MRRHTAGALGALLCVGMAVAVLAPAATGTTSGNQTFKGFLVTSGKSGERVIISSEVVAKGVLNGNGEIVEVDNLPGDPPDLLRDDLVFKGGSLHLASTVVDFSMSLDPTNCHFQATVQQVARIDGGTGQFAGASGAFTGTVDGKGVLPRNPDGSCSMDEESRHEMDRIEATGTLTY